MVSIPHPASRATASPSGLVLGLDIGGTKLAAGVVDHNGRALSVLCVPTPGVSVGWQGALDELFALGRRAMEAADVPSARIDAVGVGSGGPLDASRGVILRPPNLPGWDEVPVARLAEAEFGRPVFLDNDASAAALASARWGTWAGTANLVYVTVSTGIGGGVVVDGQLMRGVSGNVGELGHTVVVWNGRPCHCGQFGCAEAYVSGPSIALRAVEAIEAGRPSSLAQLEVVTAADVSEAAASGDVLAHEIWTDTTSILGVLVTSILNLFEPATVVLGGGVTEAGAMLIDPVRSYALAHAMSPAARSADIVISGHGRAIGVLGSAAVAMSRMESAMATA